MIRDKDGCKVHLELETDNEAGGGEVVGMQSICGALDNRASDITHLHGVMCS